MHEVYGEEFEALYEKYEKEGRARKTIPAQKLWYAILEAQIETGGPFMTYKDLANRESIILIYFFLSLTLIQANRTRRISGLSSPRTFARRSLNSLLQKKQRCATLHLWPFRLLLPMASTTSRSCTTSPKWSRTTLIESSISTTILSHKPVDRICATDRLELVCKV